MISLTKYYRQSSIHNEIMYHVNEGLTITDSVFRVGSEKYNEFVCEMRELSDKGEILISNEDDRFILESLQTGEKGLYKPRGEKAETVTLDSPEIGDKAGRKYYVFHATDEVDEESGLPIAKLIGFGDPNSEVKNDDEGARKSFLARQQCDQKDDPSTPGWWACNVHRFWKQLKLKSDKPW